jgi:hypothetical protein
MPADATACTPVGSALFEFCSQRCRMGIISSHAFHSAAAQDFNMSTWTARAARTTVSPALSASASGHARWLPAAVAVAAALLAASGSWAAVIPGSCFGTIVHAGSARPGGAYQSSAAANHVQDNGNTRAHASGTTTGFMLHALAWTGDNPTLPACCTVHTCTWQTQASVTVWDTVTLTAPAGGQPGQKLTLYVMGDLSVSARSGAVADHRHTMAFHWKVPSSYSSTSASGHFAPSPSPGPEPGSLALMAGGLVGLGALKRRHLQAGT